MKFFLGYLVLLAKYEEIYEYDDRRMSDCIYNVTILFSDVTCDCNSVSFANIINVSDSDFIKHYFGFL
jgi:hypothetical protein